jgi:hypothetical protein
MCDTRLAAPEGARDAASYPGAGGETYGDAGGSAYAGYDGEGASFPGEERRDGSLPTDIPSPQFKGAGDVISPTLEVYRKHFLLVGLLVLVTTLPLALVQYSIYAAFSSDALDGDGGGTIGATAVGVGVVATLLYWILTPLGGALLSGALAHAVVQVQRTGEARAGESLLWGLRKLPKVFVVALINYYLPFYGGLIFLAVLAFVIGPLMALPVALILLLPWIALMLTFSMAMPAAAVENRGIVGSLKRSAELTRGHKGLVFLTYFLWLVVVILLNIVTWSSFYYGADGVPELSFVSTFVQMLVGGMLSSSISVLTLYTFLGILNESRQGFAASAYAPGPEPAAR